MRILHITSCETGGVPRAMELVAAATPMHEHHVAWPRELVGDGSIFDAEHQIARSKLRALSGVRRLIETVKPDLIHAHSSWGGLYARLGIHRVPVVYQPHCFAFEGSVAPPLFRASARIAERMLAPRTSAFVALTPRERDLALSVARKGVVAIVPNVSTIDRFGPHEESSATSPVVSMIGRISRQKAPSFFAEVSRLVASARPDVRFQWIGDGDEELSANLMDAGVDITGWLGDGDLRSRLLSTTIYLHVADYEGFPLSVLDAAAMEVPVVVRAIPAFEESGLVGRTTPSELAMLILELLDDPERLLEVKAHGDRLLSRMNLFTMQQAAYHLYDSVLSMSVTRGSTRTYKEYALEHVPISEGRIEP